jgi:catechol 2,3-dioxygenase-like lactoylglutathione lyase family enzyme
MTIDHVGVVVATLESATAYYIRTFGFRLVGGVIRDPLQDVTLQFLADDRGQRIELIEPASPHSPVARALAAGGGLNHIGYRVAGLDVAIDAMVAAGAKIVRQPLPAVAFDGRRVAFLYTRQRELVELVEAG